jgi:hypothetical protein
MWSSRAWGNRRIGEIGQTLTALGLFLAEAGSPISIMAAVQKM